MNTKNIFLFIGIILLGVVAFMVLNKGIQLNPKRPPDEKPLEIIASFYPVYFFTTQIIQDRAVIENLTPSGAEPHDYEPTTQDMVRLEKADMLVLNGGVEGWVNKVKDNQGKNITIVIAGEGLFSEELEEDGKKTLDPHIWLDPKLANKEGEKIAQALIAKDDRNKTVYSEYQKKLSTKLDELDLEFKEGLTDCQKKEIITSHGAFGYLVKAYGLKQVSIAGLSPDEEPSPQQLAEIAKFAKDNNVKYIFFEKLVSPKLADTIAQEIGAKTLVLDPIEGISDDETRQGKDYFSVMRENLKNLQTALECK